MTQFDRIPIIISPDLNGYRLAFSFGEYFEPIAYYRTIEEAATSRRALLDLRNFERKSNV